MFKTSQLLSALTICGLAASVAHAGTPFAGADFDGGTTNGGFTPLTETFTPDLGPAPPSFGSFFDQFGISDRANVPFDAVDDSNNGFPNDTIGIIESTKTDNFVILTDTENGSNSGFVSAQWTFDVSGYENLQVSVDVAAIGDFEDSNPSFFLFDDYADFRVTIDSNSQETAIQLYQTEAQDLADTLYEIDMEGGGTSNAYETPFFDEDEWNFLTTNGPGNFAGTNVDYHPDDDGTGDDTTANDGFIPEPVLGNLTNEVRALTSGSFTDEEFNAFKDPLYAFTSGSTTELDDNFTTVTADITGTGSTLTLDFRGLFNGNQEFLIFDNIIISGDLIGGMLVPGDANGDMIVDTADLAILAGNFGMMNIVGGIGVGDFNEDGNVDTGDLAILAGNFGFGTGPVATAVIPEPASLALIGAGLGLAGLRRRRSA